MLNPASLGITGPITLEGWIRADTNQGSMDTPVTVIDKLDNTNGGYSLFLSSSASTNSQLQMTAQNGGAADSLVSPSYTFTESTFQHVVGVWSPSPGTMQIYINGTQVASASAAKPSISNVSTALNLGGQTTNRSWKGALDEVRISAVARDQDWIRTEFNNLDGPGIIGAPNWSDVGGVGMASGYSVSAVAVYNDELYIGGSFPSVNGLAACQNLCRWNATNGWRAVTGFTTGITPGTVFALAVYNGQLYVGGAFLNAGGVASGLCDQICRWNGAAWSDVGGGQINGTTTVKALAVYNGELYVGGSFTKVNNSTTMKYFAKFKDSTATWSAVGSSVSTTVYALAVYKGALHVGGLFTNAANITGADKIAKWDGTNWSLVGPASSITNTVWALAPYKGSLYVGGAFSSAAGNTNANGIAEWVDKCFYTVGTQEGSAGTTAPSLARLTQAYALAHDGVDTRVVELHWRTSFEADHLGFHIYREEQGARTRITPALIAGSALKGRAGTVLTAGQSYSWWDVLPLKSGSLRYWLEELDLKGGRTWHGPIDVKAAKGDKRPAQPERVRSVLLTRLGRGHASVTAAPWDGPREASTALPTEEQLAGQWKLAASVALKLGVQAEGWYRVSQAELVAAGLNPQVNTRQLQLFADGVEGPLLGIREQDGRFGPSDALEFYGLGLG